MSQGRTLNYPLPEWAKVGTRLRSKWTGHWARIVSIDCYMVDIRYDNQDPIANEPRERFDNDFYQAPDNISVDILAGLSMEEVERRLTKR